MDKLTKILSSIIPTALLLGLQIFFTKLAYNLSYPQEDEFLLGLNAKRHIIVAAFIFVCFYYAFSRIQAIYNTPKREAYLEAEGDVRLFGFIFGNIGYWLDLVAFSVISLVALKTAYPFLFDIFCANGNEYGIIYALAVVLPILAFLGFFARYSATKIWNKMLEEPTVFMSESEISKSKNAPRLIPTATALATMRLVTLASADKNSALESSGDEQFDFSLGGRIVSYLLVLIVFALCAFFAKLVYTVISFLLVPFAMLSYAKYLSTFAILALVAIPVIRRVKALVKRAQLIKGTQKICKENKYKLSQIKAPYTSLFSFYKGESFKITIDGETFSCKLLSGKKASRPIILREDGSGDIIRSINFIGIKWWESRKPFKFGYESKYRQVLIVNPSPKFLCFEKEGLRTEIDNGDCVGKYIIYSGSGFINALDRKVLGVSGKKDRYKYLDE